MEGKNTLEEFLNKSGIEILDNKMNIPFSNCSEKHIENLIKFHRRVKEYENYYELGLKNNIGKDILNYKIYLRRAKLLKNELDIKDDSYNEVLEKAKNVLKGIEKIKYIELMERANRGKEIILGNSSTKNIYFYNNKLYVRDINKMEFNMVENDLIKYILKEKKKKKFIDVKKVIPLFLEGEGLDEQSYEYIVLMTWYPKDSMKYLSRAYIDGISDIESIKENIKRLTRVDYLGII